jgi:hypothetical protein
LGIPDEDDLLQEWKEGIPLWPIEKDFNDQHRQQDFKRTGAMTWTLLRLKQTYARSWWREPRATISEALSILIGEAALKKENKARWMTYADHLGGKKELSNVLSFDNRLLLYHRAKRGVFME